MGGGTRTGAPLWVWVPGMGAPWYHHHGSLAGLKAWLPTLPGS